MNVSKNKDPHMRLFLIAVTSAILATPAAATVTFSLPPLVLRALPGEISGWGFVIANDTNYIEITSAQYCVNPVSFPACTPPTLGTFTDFISGFNDIIVGPTGGTLPSSVAQAFHLPAHQKVGSFAFNRLRSLPPTTEKLYLPITCSTPIQTVARRIYCSPV